MKVRNWDDIPTVSMAPALPGVTKQVLIGADEGARNFVMRRFALEPGASTFCHEHDWEHQILVLAGEGAFGTEGDDIPARPGDCLLVPENTKHQVKNTGASIMQFICMVPMRGEG